MCIRDRETEASGTGDFHIGIVTGSVSQSEDDRRGAEAFQAMYGEDMVKLAIYPDNFTEELETTIQTIVNLSDDPQMKAIIVNQSVPGTTEAFRKIKESRPDIICIAGEGHEDLPEIGSAADLVCNNDFVARGYLIIRTAHEPVSYTHLDVYKRQTMHSSKGLEFRVVYILDANEGITPHHKAVLDQDMEEERRMFYVAMTRAKERLHIYYVKERYHKKKEVSRFVKEAGQ